jgi:hypothetical protein
VGKARLTGRAGICTFAYFHILTLQSFRLKAMAIQNANQFFRIYRPVAAFHTQDTVTVIEVEIGPVFPVGFMNDTQQEARMVGAHYIGFKNFYHCPVFNYRSLIKQWLWLTRAQTYWQPGKFRGCKCGKLRGWIRQ